MDFIIKVVASDVQDAPPYKDLPVVGAEVTLGAVGSAVTDKDGKAKIPSGELNKIAAPVIIKIEGDTTQLVTTITPGKELVVPIAKDFPPKPAEPEPTPIEA